MANEFRIRIVVDPSQVPRGTRNVRRELDRTETAADRLASSLRRAFAFAGIAVGVTQIGRLADAFTNAQNRIRTVISDTDELSAATDELFEISNRTRQSFEGTTEVFARLGLATRELGLSQQDTLQFTESLNQAVALSGASSQEAQAGLIQLSQGLASGALRGDELRSVLEQLPAVSDVIAQSLRVTRGELRDLGSQGRITAEVVIGAFADAREELAERFANSVPTLGQAFEVFRNQLIRTIGGLDETIGVTEALSRSIIFLAENMDTLGRVAVAVGIFLGTQFAARGVRSAILAVRTLNAAILANPFVALGVGITAAISGLIAFSDQITVTSDGLVTLEDAATATFEIIGETLSPLLTALEEGFNQAISSVVEVLGELGISFDDAGSFVRSFVNRVIGLNIGLGNALRSIFSDISELIIEAIGPELIEDISGAYTAFVDFLADIFTTVRDFITDGLELIGVSVGEATQFISDLEIPDTEFTRQLRTIGGNAKDAFIEGYERDFVGDLEALVSPAIAGITGRAREIANRRIASEEAERERVRRARARLAAPGTVADRGIRAEVQTILDQLEDQTRVLGLSNREREIQNELIQIEERIKRELTDTERGLITEAINEVNALQAQSDILDELRGPQEQYNQTLEAANALLEQGQVTLQQYNQILQGTDLGGQIADLQAALLLPEDAAIAGLQTQLDMRQELIAQALEARVVTEQEANRLIVESTRQANQEIMNIETQRYSDQLQAGRSTFESLAGITRSFAGEQSRTYQTLFAISKAFTIADSTIQIANALAKAANTPFPANLGAIATVAAATSNIISTIQGAQFAGGFQTGGSFMVGGQGGPDSQLVSFMATPGESVTIETPAQRERRSSSDGPTVIINQENNFAAPTDRRTQQQLRAATFDAGQQAAVRIS